VTRKIIATCLFICLAGCKEPVKEVDLHYLNGYWEISKVVFENGSTKEYAVNSTIDYFELDGLQGFRKKVQPNLNGGFATSDDAESFQIIRKNNDYIIQYTNAQSSWEEEIIQVSQNFHIVRNTDGINYHYKRFTPIGSAN